jgi:hypothetical protein
LTELENVRENLLALSDDIWLEIDHNDSEAVKKGAEFKLAYNEKMAEFERVAQELSDLVQRFAGIDMTGDEEEAGRATDTATRDRVIMDLDKQERHDLTEDFRYKRPYGFVLGEMVVKKARTWRRMFELVCRALAERDPERFKSLPDNNDFVSNRGFAYFARDPVHLRTPMELPRGIYAEANLSANSIRDRIRNLLRTFGVPEDKMVVYLRQDRDAEDEVGG